VHVGEGPDAGGRLAIDAYADDIAVIAESETNAQLIVEQIEILARPLGLELNAGKCKVMYFGEDTAVPSIKLGDEELEVVNSFVYLGSKISARPVADDEVKRRKAVARGQMLKLTTLWTDKTTELNVKLRIHLSHVRPILQYGLHILPLTKSHENSIDACERGHIRWALGLGWKSGDHFLSADGLHKCIRALSSGRHWLPMSEVVKQARLAWLGHCLRGPAEMIARRVMFSEHKPRRRTGGYMKCTWHDGVLDETMNWHRARSKRDAREAQTRALLPLAQDRVGWRKHTKNKFVGHTERRTRGIPRR
jgi:hypothetical protein